MPNSTVQAAKNTVGLLVRAHSPLRLLVLKLAENLTMAGVAEETLWPALSASFAEWSSLMAGRGSNKGRSL